MLHVHPDLVCATGLQYTLYQRYISQAFDSAIVRNSTLATLSVGVYGHLQAVFCATTYVTFNATLVVFHSTPYEGYVLALGGLVEELYTQVCLSIGCFGYYK